ncbi:hypothetical protein [Lentzea flava]|uniref:Uncharacterized protein n=1 Tax=Lentzea flava TaxID=103732 RepID=A0ABQ2UN61_9PSEU|nr:hypothetical protein [Lentzea flava]MCP2200064.1 hypothetical protein [Lentzea flava]GGU45893.1 hypothetical protein GCM10010178_42990 [Lentzea flava]
MPTGPTVLKLNHLIVGAEPNPEFGISRRYIYGDWIAYTSSDQPFTRFTGSANWTFEEVSRACDGWLESTEFQRSSEWDRDLSGEYKCRIKRRPEINTS